MNQYILYKIDKIFTEKSFIMLKVSLLELCLRGFPESLLFVWAINYINMKKINKRTWILLCIFLTIIVYFVRMLNIQYGAHVFIILVILIGSAHYISKLSLINSISSSLIVVILLSICEFANLIIITYLFKVNIQKIVNIPWMKFLILLPSLILFILFILIFNSINIKSISKGNV